MRCDIPCLYFTARLRRPLSWHGYEVARWLLVSTITTLSTSLKWQCPGQQSTFLGPQSKIAKQQWEEAFLFYTMEVKWFYITLMLLLPLQPACLLWHYLFLLPFTMSISHFLKIMSTISFPDLMTILIMHLQTEASRSHCIWFHPPPQSEWDNGKKFKK